jgi:hypothetical protein
MNLARRPIVERRPLTFIAATVGVETVAPRDVVGVAEGTATLRVGIMKLHARERALSSMDRQRLEAQIRDS